MRIRCSECGSRNLTWENGARNSGGAVDGLLQLHDVSGIFILGCDECSATIKVVTASQVADYLNRKGIQHIETPVAKGLGSAEADEVCDAAPEGWDCTRKKGHDGPCAAVPGTRPLPDDIHTARAKELFHTDNPGATERQYAKSYNLGHALGSVAGGKP